MNLKKLRKERNLSQKQFAEIFHSSQNTVSQWENGTREPSIKTIQDIANFFGVTTDYLLGNDDTPKKSDLTNRDKREIADVIEEYKEQLLSADGLMLDGEMIDEEDVQKIITAMQLGMEMIKKDNKERFTPKKYRK